MSLMVTLALAAKDAETVIFEWSTPRCGCPWRPKETTWAARVLEPGTIYVGVPR